MRHIKKIADYSIVGGMGAVLMVGLTGCVGEDPRAEQNMQNQTDSVGSEMSQKQGAFVVIQETAPDKYTIVDEFPSDTTRIILKKLDGSEKMLTQAEMDALVKNEAAKIDAGTSELTQNPDEVSSGSGGMGLGGTILASMAGAMLGSYIGNKLFNNQNYQKNRQSGYKNPQTYNKSKKSFSKSRTSKKSGYFNNNKKSTGTSKKRSGFFGKKSSSRGFGG